ncbi:hypothetical protein, partial [Streptomyces sp. NPDC001833]|uniref:hypothetical protein n=1 Tax=Streptomyces sp. NPDC001833 TaxID=3154658 RepID=UPI00332FE7F7
PSSSPPAPPGSAPSTPSTRSCRSPRGPLAQFADGSLTTALAHAATCTVVLVDPADAPLPLTASTLVELRERPA